ncbi:MAG: hypothetical protein ACRDSR_10705 [Pseudonocardiaceae bacterium]
MDESFAASAAGKVLDASAIAAWAYGHVGMQTWFGIAWELQLSFYLPAFARSEAVLSIPSPAGSCTPAGSEDGPPSQRTPDASGASIRTYR